MTHEACIKNTLRVRAPHFEILDSTFSCLDYTFWLDSMLKIFTGVHVYLRAADQAPVAQAQTISETGQDSYYWWPIESRIRAFDWCENQQPWMTFKGHYARCFKTHASFGAHHENLNEDRPYYQRRRCSPMTLDSGNIRFIRIFMVVLQIYVNFP